MARSHAKLLEAKNVHVSFGGIQALCGVELSLRTGDILGLIGPNGAGKTTMVNVLTGFQKTKPGAVLLDERNVSSLSATDMARAGIARSFQAARLFRGLSVIENLTVAGLGIGLSKKQAIEQSRDILEWMGLQREADQSCTSLSYSSERRVSIARALALRPSFVLLDEPASGMNDQECENLMEVIVRIPKQIECGVMLIEHNMQVIMGVCHRVHVLDGGRSLAEGPPERIKTDPLVLRAYLGDDASRTNARV
ncbi:MULTISPECIES: ABC transporter ATP-binding protein [unclassified Aureimonas]|uniref:ABC transporter ATP-binding protein n=1 Tax=unclassified Aureimonas TaxID=2615206 RepID=UPI0006F22579|nr:MULTISPECIES: ABC transporter ATP-binding protein [unclassified Aureimonas]KQT62934.1 ABC transporter ATP-binding protein [Aureimonas sp. Leaf427]KQT74829.1 ABC transporter ATP-binding protein [Aureimonas sp. Leaf460]